MRAMLWRNRNSRILLGAILVLALVVPSVGALEVNDVPPGHWAHEAVSTLLERGYLPPAEDQLFRGDEAVDRYTLASVVAQLLVEVESGRATTTSEDLRTLQRLTEELREDLVTYYAEVQRLDGRVEGAHEELTAFDERLVQVIRELGTLYARAVELEEALALTDQRFAASLHNESESLYEQIRSVGRNLEALGESFTLDVRNLRGEVSAVGELLDQRSVELLGEAYEADAELRSDLMRQIGELWDEAQRLATTDERILGEASDLDRRLTAETQALRTALRELERQIDFALGIQTAEVEESLIHSMRTLGSRIDGLASAVFALENELQLQAALLYDLELRINDRISADIESLQGAMSDLSAAHDDLAASFTAELGLLREQLQVLRAEQVQSQSVALADLAERLEGEVEREAQETAGRLQVLDGAIAEIRAELNMHSEALAAYELGLNQLAGDLQRQGEAMARADGELLRTIEAVRADSAAMSTRLAALDARLEGLDSDLAGQVVSLQNRTGELDRRIDDLRQELLIVQSHLGLSEEQIEDLTRRVRDEMAEQLTLSLLREGELQRNLRDLRTEFDSYRSTSEGEIRSLRSGQAIGIGALVLGILGLVR